MNEEESFKITDRRGRGDAGAGPGPAGSRSPDTAPERDRGARPQPSTGAPGAAKSDLGALFVMFATSALMSLGAVPAPEAEQGGVDLAQAQSAIDILLMLREKTQGNRSEHESQLLEDILYDLQMRFVRAVGGAAQPSAS